jgi:hypothetical protein
MMILPGIVALLELVCLPSLENDRLPVFRRSMSKKDLHYFDGYKRPGKIFTIGSFDSNEQVLYEDGIFKPEIGCC